MPPTTEMMEQEERERKEAIENIAKILLSDDVDESIKKLPAEKLEAIGRIMFDVIGTVIGLSFELGKREGAEKEE